MNLRFAHHRRAGLASFLAIAAFGCSKSPRAASVSDAGVVEPAASAAAASTTSPAAPAQSVIVPGVGIANRLLNESLNRPTGTPKAEDVYAALAKAGMKIVETQQHSALPFGAQYCLGAKVENQLHMSVCEFSSVQAAKDGRDMSLKAFKVVANREIFVNKATTFTVREESKTPAIDAVEKRAVQLFNEL